MLVPLTIVEADLGRPDHQEAVVALTDAYASDPMGSGRPLPDAARRSLIAGLRAQPTVVIFLAYQDGEPVGIATCFRGFSTFAARPLINIHDLAVLPSHRGRGIGRRLLDAVEQRARATGCCKVTLEVQEDNARARRIYEAAGFGPTVYAPGAGRALFFSKPL
jgi:ribosomal protein S18 acetylase RimI-like enzyme